MLPKSIGLRIVGVSLVGLASACATATSSPRPTVGAPSEAEHRAEMQALRGEIERQREELRVLRGRLALAEAESRELRSARSLVERGRTITIGDGAPATDIDWIEPELAQDDAWLAVEEPRENDRAPRIVLADDLPIVAEAPRPAPVPVRPAPPVPVRVVPPSAPRSSTPAPITAAPAPVAIPSPVSVDAAADYRAALEAVRGRRLDEALRLLDRFLETHPRHDYADNALYWQGEIHFVAGRLPQARAAYERIVRDHGQGNKVSDALLRLGVCAQRLGEAERARAYFRELRARFPESPAARRAPEEAT